MLISVDWIKDFVDLPSELTPSELGKRFTLGTAEVEEVKVLKEHLAQIKTAVVLEINPHPEAENLNLVRFDYGGSEHKTVVCGAKNVRVGMITAFAPIGVTLPNGLTLAPKKIRGILSEGMLCSEEELGFAESSSGIVDLDAQAKLGVTMLEYFDEVQDILIEVDNKSLTHRPDLWGQYGLAREFGAVFDSKLKNPFSEAWQKKLEAKFSSEEAPIRPVMEGDSSCLSYYGLCIDGIVVTDSPKWMQRRLLAVGLRPINLIVDISNYVMSELGFPNHIFDRDLIEGDEVIIKTLPQNEAFFTLDELERSLKTGDTVISDKTKTLVLAGIMGGVNSGVSTQSTRIFLEVANWKAAEVRKTSTRLGLRTDSSQRYEKGLDSQMSYRSLLRMMELILELCPGARVRGAPTYVGNNIQDIQPREIVTSVQRISKILGKKISEERVTSILSALDFQVSAAGTELRVRVPSYRATKDIECESCIVEEVGRIVGFDNILPLSPKLDIFPVRLTRAQKLQRSIQDFLSVHDSCFEVMTYPMIGPKLYEKAQWPALGGPQLINSLSLDTSLMRNSIVPSFLEAAALNAKNFEQFRFFELGRSYHSDEKCFSKEKSLVGLCFFDKRESPFMSCLNSTEALLRATQIPADIADPHPKFKNNLVDENWKGLHPYEFQNIRMMGKMDGAVFSVHPLVLRNFKIKGFVSIAILDLSSVEMSTVGDKIKYQPLSKYPTSTFDWSIVASSISRVGDILAQLKKVKIKELRSVKVLDTYQMSAEEKSITLRATFADPEKTLSGDFITQATSQLVLSCEKAGYPLKV